MITFDDLVYISLTGLSCLMSFKYHIGSNIYTPSNVFTCVIWKKCHFYQRRFCLLENRLFLPKTINQLNLNPQQGHSYLNLSSSKSSTLISSLACNAFAIPNPYSDKSMPNDSISIASLSSSHVENSAT